LCPHRAEATEIDRNVPVPPAGGAESRRGLLLLPRRVLAHPVRTRAAIGPLPRLGLLLAAARAALGLLASPPLVVPLPVPSIAAQVDPATLPAPLRPVRQGIPPPPNEVQELRLPRVVRPLRKRPPTRIREWPPI